MSSLHVCSRTHFVLDARGWMISHLGVAAKIIHGKLIVVHVELRHRHLVRRYLQSAADCFVVSLPDRGRPRAATRLAPRRSADNNRGLPARRPAQRLRSGTRPRAFMVS